jgi:hypothetical protein
MKGYALRQIAFMVENEAGKDFLWTPDLLLQGFFW